MSRPIYELGMKWCPKCDVVQSLEAFYKNSRNKDGRQGYCVPCWKEKVREWQKATPERYKRYVANRKRRSTNPWGDEHRKERLVHQKVGRAIAKGVLVRPNVCSECGAAGRVEAHHHDYDLPLDVAWLCTKCHKEKHPKVYVPR